MFKTFLYLLSEHASYIQEYQPVPFGSNTVRVTECRRIKFFRQQTANCFPLLLPCFCNTLVDSRHGIPEATGVFHRH
jgi:hypothetical protein